MNFTVQTVAGGAMTGAILGAAYGILASPRGDKEADAKHYGLLFGAVGAFLGGILAGPPVIVATPTS